MGTPPPSQPPYWLMNSTSVPFNSTETEVVYDELEPEEQTIPPYWWMNSTSFPTNSTARPDITSTTIASSTTPETEIFFDDLMPREKKEEKKDLWQITKSQVNQDIRV